VQHVTFISKAQALTEMKKSNPGIYKVTRTARNPLPDAFTVVATSPSGVKTIRASVVHAPGVAAAKLTPCSLTR
jgi:cell division protein FtsX